MLRLVRVGVGPLQQAAVGSLGGLFEASWLMSEGESERSPDVDAQLDDFFTPIVKELDALDARGVEDDFFDILRHHLHPDRVSPTTLESLIDALSGFLSDQAV